MELQEKIRQAWLAQNKPGKGAWWYAILGVLGIITSLVIAVFTLIQGEYIAFVLYILIAIPVLWVLMWHFGIRVIRSARSVRKHLEAGEFRTVAVTCASVETTQEKPCGADSSPEDHSVITFAAEDASYTLEYWGVAEGIAPQQEYHLVFMNTEDISMVYCPRQDKIVYLGN